MNNINVSDSCRFSNRYLVGVTLVGLILLVNSAAYAQTGDWVNAADYGYDPLDATDALQNAIYSGKNVFVPNMGSDWIVRPISLYSNEEILFEDGVVVTAKRGEFQYNKDCLFTGNGIANTRLSGTNVTFRMWKNDYMNPPYDPGEWRMGISLWGVTNITIEDITIQDTGGDGIYICGRYVGETNLPSQNIVIRNVTCDNVSRQGIAIISAKNVLIDNCIIKNGPASGIDFEPNDDREIIDECEVRNTILHNNVGFGVTVFTGPTHEPNVVVDNCTFVDNDNSGFLALYGSPGVFVSDSLFVDNGGYGVDQDNLNASNAILEPTYCAFWSNTSGPVGGYAIEGTGCVTTAEPIFASTDPASSNYMYLAETCPIAITEGDSEGSSIGARSAPPEPECGDDDHQYPKADVTEDCIVNLADFAVVASTWLADSNP